MKTVLITGANKGIGLETEGNCSRWDILFTWAAEYFSM